MNVPCPSSVFLQDFTFTSGVPEFTFVGQEEVLLFLELGTAINICDAACLT